MASSSNPKFLVVTGVAVSSIKSKFLTVIHVNVCSLFEHFAELTFLASAERPHFIAISETWLKYSVTNNEIHHAG